MPPLRFHVPNAEVPGVRADAQVGRTIFKGLVEPRDVRRLHASIMEAAFVAESSGLDHVALVLDSPQLSESRLRLEWARAEAVLRPEIMKRLSMIIQQEHLPPKVFGEILPEALARLPMFLAELRGSTYRGTRRQPEAFFEVLRVLLIHWVKRTGPIALRELCAQTGFTYPTIAAALEKLGSHLVRHSDRKVDLSSFPLEPWFRLLASSTEVRSTRCFVDRSGRPRPPEKLLDRLREMGRLDLAVGGVFGARHYMPGIDLVGSARLDLAIHSPSGQLLDDCVCRLDPALKPALDGEPIHLVLHYLHRPASFFEQGHDGWIWADQIECLLDLHEARLEPQAMELREHLAPKE